MALINFLIKCKWLLASHGHASVDSFTLAFYGLFLMIVTTIIIAIWSIRISKRMAQQTLEKSNRATYGFNTLAWHLIYTILNGTF